MAMAIVSAVTLGFVLVTNGLYMLYDPTGWYSLVPGVPDTGPLNIHFVRDIGCAYVMAGGAVAWLCFDPRARPGALAAAAFLTLHALVHVAEEIGGQSHSGHMLSELVAVFVPAAVALWLTLPITPISRRQTMLKWLIKRQIAAFERSYGYDTSYARHLLEVDTAAFMKLAKVRGMAQYRKSVPAPAWYAAKLAATLAEDCGPCTQLVVTMAEREGLPPSMLKAMVTGGACALPDDAALGMRFAKAVMSHDPMADNLRADIVSRWGEQGLVSLAFAVATGRIFPTVKSALGHSQACRRVMVDGTELAVLKQAA
jgi:uncharacterized protein YjeT (DUF2065 family)